MIEATELLEKATADERSGLHKLLEGPRFDDEKGEKEANEFSSLCGSIRLDVTRSMVALESAIASEMRKPATRGERRKRLRTLVEALAIWWLSGGGRSVAPYVKANRRDGGRAIVHGRFGKFYALAIAVLCNVDVFKSSEVEAAVTNVHEAQLRMKKIAPVHFPKALVGSVR